MSHVHAFHSWTFREPVETGTFTTRPVLEDAQPIVDVFHDSNGDWQFLCGTTLEFDDLKLVCLGCMVERDATLLELADLPLGWAAFRDGPGAPWRREAFDDGDDEA